MLGEDFLTKIKNLEKYYQSVPEVDHEQFGLFKDFLDFLTFEDLELLVYSYIQKHEGDPGYNLANVKVIENRHDFGDMHQYLEGLTTLKDGMDAKLLLKIKKGEPAHYSPNMGVHVIFSYLRCEKGVLSVFIMDQAAGIICETRDGFNNMVSVIETYAKKFYGPNYRIIKSSAINQNDARNCPIYGLGALHYFIKKGHEFFPSINNDLVPQDQKVFDQKNDKIFHLRADALPASLVKMSNRRSLERVNAAYHHQWMPVQVQLTSTYTQNTQELVWRVLNNPVGKHPEKTLQRYFDLHAEMRKNSSGQTYTHNTAAEKGMRKARKNILWLLRVSQTVESSGDEKPQINESALNGLFNKIRKK